MWSGTRTRCGSGSTPTGRASGWPRAGSRGPTRESTSRSSPSPHALRTGGGWSRSGSAGWRSGTRSWSAARWASRCSSCATTRRRPGAAPRRGTGTRSMPWGRSRCCPTGAKGPWRSRWRRPSATRTRTVSPWGGMSGAAVWSAGRVIGLIAEHHRSDGLGRLAATRVDRWHERLSPARLRQLCGLTGLPAKPGDLREVVPPIGSELVEAGYHAQVRDIAPWELRGREEELAELVRFCAGDEPYQWWLADAWAGKSALAAWFVLHPPAGVRVASFFVTRRLAGQADSDAFTEEMVEQLAVIADEPTAQATTPSGRDRERIRLLELAARRVGEGQERLLLVVDGLDEDEGARPASGKPSIASLLPRRPAGNVRVLVTSRPHPGIPDDVPGGHPLRHCVPRLLDPSPFAHHIEVAAKNELMEQLHGDQLQVDILGYVTASGGGLAIADLAELTGSPAVGPRRQAQDRLRPEPDDPRPAWPGARRSRRRRVPVRPRDAGCGRRGDPGQRPRALPAAPPRVGGRLPRARLAGRHPAVPAAAVLDAARRQGQGRPPAAGRPRDRPSATRPAARGHARGRRRDRGDRHRAGARARAAGARPRHPRAAGRPPRPPGGPQRAPARRAARPAGPRGPAPAGRGDRQEHAHARPAQGARRRGRRPRRRRPVGAGRADGARDHRHGLQGQGAGLGGQGDDGGGPGAGRPPAGGGRPGRPRASPSPTCGRSPSPPWPRRSPTPGCGSGPRRPPTPSSRSTPRPGPGRCGWWSTRWSPTASGTVPSGPPRPFPASGTRPRPRPRWPPPSPATTGNGPWPCSSRSRGPLAATSHRQATPSRWA